MVDTCGYDLISIEIESEEILTKGKIGIMGLRERN